MKYTIAVALFLLIGAGCSPATEQQALIDEDQNTKTMPAEPEPNATVENEVEDPVGQPVDDLTDPDNIQDIPSMAYATLEGQQDLASDYNAAILHTNLGDITVTLYADASPKTVNNFLNLAQAGEYNGTKFHRVIKDFMIQGGDPLSKDDAKQAFWGTGGPDYRFEDEFNDKPLVRGSLAMANAGPNTNGSQFFIVTAAATPWLDGKHTNFGYVYDGMNVVDQVENAQTAPGDRPLENIVVESIELGNLKSEV